MKTSLGSTDLSFFLIRLQIIIKKKLLEKRFKKKVVLTKTVETKVVFIIINQSLLEAEFARNKVC
jgi:hypothetical protein